MSRSIRKETSSLALGMVGRFGGSSAGFAVAALNAASAASVVVLRVLSAGICVLALGLHFLKSKLSTVMMRWIILEEPSGPNGSHHRALARRLIAVRRRGCLRCLSPHIPVFRAKPRSHS